MEHEKNFEERQGRAWSEEAAVRRAGAITTVFFAAASG